MRRNMTDSRSKYGPSRGELWFRLVFSLAGLAFMALAVFYRGITGLAWFEIMIFGGLFFGATTVWCILKLLRRDHP